MRRRAVLALALLMFAGGCHREPSFEERYASDEAMLRDKAASIDSEITVRASEAAAAGETDEALATASD